MFINDKMYFSKSCKVEDAKQLYREFEEARDTENVREATKKFQDICRYMKQRVDDHYISPIKTFLHATRTHDHREQYGFIVMSVNCILIEFYYEMLKGYDQSDHDGSARHAYITILPQLDSEITEEEATVFFKGIRCGIVHQGQTKKNVAITCEYEKIIGRIGKYYLCNPETLFKTLIEHYKAYWDLLSMKKYTDLESKCLIKKFDYILGHIR